MMLIEKQAPFGDILSNDAVQQTLHAGLSGEFTDQRVLVLVPDHTRTLPLPFLFRALVEVLHDVKRLDCMVALGTHPPLDESSLLGLVGITHEQRSSEYAKI